MCIKFRKSSLLQIFYIFCIVFLKRTVWGKYDNFNALFAFFPPKTHISELHWEGKFIRDSYFYMVLS